MDNYGSGIYRLRIRATQTNELTVTATPTTISIMEITVNHRVL